MRDLLTKQKLVIVTLALFTLVWSARGQGTVQVPVTPDLLEYSNYVFTVAAMPTNTGTAFHVTITTKTQPIGFDCIACLTMINANATFKLPDIKGLTPPVPVTLNRNAQVWMADFTASSDVLNNPDVYFIFVVPDYATHADGTRTYLPSDRIYEIRLQDFVKH